MKGLKEWEKSVRLKKQRSEHIRKINRTKSVVYFLHAPDCGLFIDCFAQGVLRGHRVM